MLILDYANCLSTRVGSHGVDPALLEAGSRAAASVAAASERLAKTRGTGWERWRQLPFDPMKGEHVKGVRATVDACKGRFHTVVVLGIGGSALGNIALQSALNPPTYNLLDATARPGPRLFVIDNVDPDNFGAILDFCASAKGEGQAPPGLAGTLFNVISKSGETAETAAQFMVVRDALRKALGTSFAKNIVAITDPAKGTMRRICDADGYATLPVPEGVGGRFSVLSPVGLFSAAMCGISIEELLAGAAEMDAECSRAELGKNPAAMLAWLLVEMGTTLGKTNHVMMPYANGLYLLADWYRQLWAESLGKRVDRSGETVYAGFTPIKALGATDQHSQIQLYREGPNDKVIGLVQVERFARDVGVPSGLGVEATKYLEGASMGGLLNVEKRATEYALVESQRPNYTISFPRVDARHVGQFIQLWQVATAYAGVLLNVDAYDQPAVELGKQATFGLMGRAGYEAFKQKVDQTLVATKQVIGR
ncbi:MAG: glucose-6-phosphate isomerase [Planctomycetota bacterium]|nr:glucose-6-phosphate isomerase [Planctomycetota bacterium]